MQGLRNIENRWVIGWGILFSIINVLFIVTETYWGLLLPFAFALIALVVLALDKVLLFLIFATPLSITYSPPDMGVSFALPTEPILFGIMLLFIFKLLYQGGFDMKVLKHPLTIAILFNLFWIFFTSFSSQLPLVSFKFFLARLWFLSVYFFLVSQLFKKEKNIKLFFWLFMVPLAGAVLYTLFVHSQNGFTKESSTWVMFPFFKEHTSYGAVLAMYIPIAFVFSFVIKNGLNNRIFGFLLFAILFVGVIFSFTRAAWLSIAASILLMLLLVFKVRKEIVILIVVAFLGTLWNYKDDILKRFEKNEQVSSDNLTEHVESISNVSTDPSNLERINRWKSAFRMFNERPFLGSGPGTYMFLYAPYQKPFEKTIISTNAGDLGNAHSEYIGPLAESGILGVLSVLAIVALTFYTGIRVYKRLKDYDLKMIALATLMGLVTYWVHGFLNNFLEMDKAACPVWGFTALLIILDQYYCKPESKID